MAEALRTFSTNSYGAGSIRLTKGLRFQATILKKAEKSFKEEATAGRFLPVGTRRARVMLVASEYFQVVSLGASEILFTMETVD